MKIVWWNIAVVGCLAVLTGCVTLPQVGGERQPLAAGESVYRGGELHGMEKAELDAVYKAAIAALEHLGFNVTWKEHTALEARVEGRGVDDRKVGIRLSRHDAQHTGIRIRVGLTGHREHSQAILERIRQQLTTPKARRFYADP